MKPVALQSTINQYKPFAVAACVLKNPENECLSQPATGECDRLLYHIAASFGHGDKASAGIIEDVYAFAKKNYTGAAIYQKGSGYQK